MLKLLKKLFTRRRQSGVASIGLSASMTPRLTKET